MICHNIFFPKSLVIFSVYFCRMQGLFKINAYDVIAEAPVLCSRTLN